MSTSAVTLPAAQSQPVARPLPASSTPAKAPTAAAGTKGTPQASAVRISAAGLAALQESRETPAQTSAEARRGDSAAKALLAKQAAHAAEFKANSK